MSDEQKVVADQGVKEKLEEVFSKVFVKGGIEGDEYFAGLLNYSPESTLAVDVIMKAPCVTKITTDEAVIREAIHNSKSFVVCNNVVKSSAIKLEQNTLILRDISGAESGEIVEIFSSSVCPDGSPCPPITAIRPDMNDTWFVIFSSEENAKLALTAIKDKKYKDKPIRARLKPESSLKSFYSNNSANQPSSISVPGAPGVVPSVGGGPEGVPGSPSAGAAVLAGGPPGAGGVPSVVPPGVIPPATLAGYPGGAVLPPGAGGPFGPAYGFSVPPPGAPMAYPFAMGPGGMPLMNYPMMAPGVMPMMPQQINPYMFMGPPGGFMPPGGQQGQHQGGQHPHQQQQQGGGYNQNRNNAGMNKQYNNNGNYQNRNNSMGGNYQNNRGPNGQYRNNNNAGSPRSGSNNYPNSPQGPYVQRSFSADSSGGQHHQQQGQGHHQQSQYHHHQQQHQGHHQGHNLQSHSADAVHSKAHAPSSSGATAASAGSSSTQDSKKPEEGGSESSAAVSSAEGTASSAAPGESAIPEGEAAKVEKKAVNKGNNTQSSSNNNNSQQKDSKGEAGKDGKGRQQSTDGNKTGNRGAGGGGGGDRRSDSNKEGGNKSSNRDGGNKSEGGTRRKDGGNREGGRAGKTGSGDAADKPAAPKKVIEFNMEADFPILIESETQPTSTTGSGTSGSKPTFDYASAVKKSSPPVLVAAPVAPVTAAVTAAPKEGGKSSKKGGNKSESNVSRSNDSVASEALPKEVPSASSGSENDNHASAEKGNASVDSAAGSAASSSIASGGDSAPMFTFGSFSAPVQFNDESRFSGPSTATAAPSSALAPAAASSAPAVHTTSTTAVAAVAPVCVVPAGHPYVSQRPATQVTEVVAPPRPVTMPVAPAAIATGSNSTVVTGDEASGTSVSSGAGGAWGGAKKTFVDIVRTK